MFVLHFNCQSKEAQLLGNFSSFEKCQIYFDKFSEARSYASSVLRGFVRPYSVDSDVLFYSARILNLKNGKEHVVV